MRIASLTSIPSRFDALYRTLEGLQRQAFDEVRLYIPEQYSRFPDWNGVVPDVPGGVKVLRSDRDYGPATKILPACRDLRNEDVQVLFCDDDIRVPKGWADRLFRIQKERSHEAVATYIQTAEGYGVTRLIARQGIYARQLSLHLDPFYRFLRLVHKLLGTPAPHPRPFIIPGYGDILFGVGGVVVRPSFFDDEAFEIPDEVWFVDDIWLSSQLARKGIRIYCPWRCPLPLAEDHADTDSLLGLEVGGKNRNQQNLLAVSFCQSRFGIW
jgi:hypothetical protein